MARACAQPMAHAGVDAHGVEVGCAVFDAGLAEIRY